MPRGRKGTATCTKMIEKPIEPTYRWEVTVTHADDDGRVAIDQVDVYAQVVGVDGDDLNFYELDKDRNENLVASFKNWSYFIRRESDQQRAAEKWGEGFEKLAKKTTEDPKGPLFP